jgi:hypothetical protein
LSSTQQANHHCARHVGNSAGDIPDRVFKRHSTGSGPASLATIRAAITVAIKDAGYLHIPEGRRDHTTPAETLHLHGFD